MKSSKRKLDDLLFCVTENEKGTDKKPCLHEKKFLSPKRYRQESNEYPTSSTTTTCKVIEVPESQNVSKLLLQRIGSSKEGKLGSWIASSDFIFQKAPLSIQPYRNCPCRNMPAKSTTTTPDTMDFSASQE